MLTSYKIIPPFLSAIEIDFFKAQAEEKSAEFINHKSTKTGEPSPLNFLPIEFRGIERVCIMKMLPHSEMPWHTDGTNLKRNTLIIHPLSDDYAPLVTKQGEVTTTALVNTQEEHAVFNNTDSSRLNLQIPLDIDFEELVANKKHKAWEFIERLYQ